ncbi:exonuclease V [Xenopus laevis]|uniref:Exonuclease V n=2 Tax=Xenopus laevis TaxID=8355 RepID=A0A1L8HDX4_XENLA|nr:exonuclease V [Xenopus laevis]OCT94275.1 hypothetical protein XELAEV_18011943mg [Xenopus laevis]
MSDAGELNLQTGACIDTATKEDSDALFMHGQHSDEDEFSDISDSELLKIHEEAVNEDKGGGKMVQTTEGGSRSSGNCADVAGCSVVSFQIEENKEKSQGHEGSSHRKRKQMPIMPMEKYRMKYLWVTNLCSQAWCEQQMMYEFEFPELLKLEKTDAMNKGASIHLARELEVHDVVSVTTQTKEDSWAIKFLNILSMIPVLQSGARVREFPVFRELNGIFVVGMIDELGYTPKGELELRELKTRTTPTLPGTSQTVTHQFQVSLYKLLFDGMVTGLVQPDVFIQHLQLKPDQALGEQVIEHVKRAGFTASTFGDLLDLTCLNLTFSELPTIDCLKLEYCYQADGTSLGFKTVTFEEEKLMELLNSCLSFWKGQKEAQGVDIEEAWKCRHCSFASICEWRTRRSEHLSRTGQSKRTK